MPVKTRVSQAHNAFALIVAYASRGYLVPVLGILVGRSILLFWVDLGLPFFRNSFVPRDPPHSKYQIRFVTVSRVAAVSACGATLHR